NFSLLIASYYFYLCWNPRYILLLFLSTVITYCASLYIQRENNKKNSNKTIQLNKKKIIFVSAIVINFGILFFYKYFNFALESVYSVLDLFLGVGIHRKFDIVLPVGISFFTFQAIGYMFDVYRQDTYAEKNFIQYALFV